MLRSLVTLLLVASLLAGCSDKGGEATDELGVTFEDEVVVTASTGAIRGIVLSESITPLAGATVTLLAANQTRTTGEDGTFVFNALEPGNHFIGVAKLGYFSVQSSAEVVAGVAEPPITKVVLVLDVASQPFTELYKWSAFLQCGVGVPGAGSVNPCLFTGSDNVHYFGFGKNVTFGQAEAVWSGTQPMGNMLYFEMAGTGINGESPLVIRLTGEELEDAANDDDEVMGRVFAGDEAPTLVLNQGYDIYMQFFYNFVPREGYLMAVDGPCEPVEVCS